MKRKHSDTNQNVKKIKKRKFKYEYTPDMKNKPVPIHYIYDRLATDEQIKTLEKEIYLKNKFYKNLNDYDFELINSLASTERIQLDNIVYYMLDNDLPTWIIEEEVENFLDEIFG